MPELWTLPAATRKTITARFAGLQTAVDARRDEIQRCQNKLTELEYDQLTAVNAIRKMLAEYPDLK
jgi:hypothetical protein